MKSIKVPFLTGFVDLDRFAKAAVDVVDWPDEYPYKPDVVLAIAHDSEKLYIRFDVKEGNVRAVTTEAEGPVWEDSCVEFFVKEPDSPYYFNFETNCIGVGLSARRLSRNDFERLSPEMLATVKRRSSLPAASL